MTVTRRWQCPGCGRTGSIPAGAAPPEFCQDCLEDNRRSANTKWTVFIIATVCAVLATGAIVLVLISPQLQINSDVSKQNKDKPSDRNDFWDGDANEKTDQPIQKSWERPEIKVARARLHLVDVHWKRMGTSGFNARYVIVEGRVRNTGNVSIENVKVVAQFFSVDRKLVTSKTRSIEYDPILPGQTSPFKISYVKYDPRMNKCSVEFKRLFGGTIPTTR